MDRLEAMSILVAAVEQGSLSGAGRKLGMPLPSVSRKLSELEAHLGTRLLMRTTRRLALTDAGAAYVAACRRILEDVREAERTAAGEYSAPRGELVVTAPIAFGRLHVLPAINEFLAQYEAISVRLVLSDRNVDLIDDHIDIAVRIGALADSSMVATRLGTMRRVVCASPGFLDRHGTPRCPADLAGMPGVSIEVLAPQAMLRFAGGEQVRLAQRLSVNTAESVVDAVAAGLGVTGLLYYQVARAVADDRLRIILAEFEPDPLPVSLVHAGQGLLPHKTRAFLDFLAPRLRTVLAALSSNQDGLERNQHW